MTGTKLYKIRIKTGDTVMVRSGKYRGRTGKVLAVYPKLNKAKVEGINVVKKHRKPTQQHPQGGIIDINKPIWIGKLGILDSVSKKPSRVGYKTTGSGGKIRILKTSGKEVK